MELLYKITGMILLLLALLHLVFPRYFQWKKELSSLSLINRQMMIVHTFFIALTVFMIGLLCVTMPGELLHTHLGRVIAKGIGVFWFTRLLVQFIGYSPALWKGKRFETIMHILFTLLWTWLTVIFWL